MEYAYWMWEKGGKKNVCFFINKIHGLQVDENLNTNYGRLFATCENIG